MADEGGQSERRWGPDRAEEAGRGQNVRATYQPSEGVMSARFMLTPTPAAQILWRGSCLFVFQPETLEFFTVCLLHSQMLRALRRSCTFPFYSKLPTSKPKNPQAFGESWVSYLIILI